MEKKYIQYEYFLERENNLNKMKEQGFKFIIKKNKFKIFCGISCLVVAIIPNGLGLLLYPLGFYLLGINTTDLFLFKDKLRKRTKRFLK